MRKLLNIIGLSAAVLLTSCDMDKIPQGSLDQGEAFKDLKTVEYLANGAYARLRDNYGIENMILPDIQADYVNALSGYSNTYGEVYKWIFTQNDYDVTAAWEVCYMTIAQCNFIIDGIDKNIDNFKPKDQPALDLINGRMFLMRAMSYSMLAERFCADYNAATATKEFSGVPIIPNYNPDEKPSRATLAQVYDAILADIAQAKVYLKKTAGSPSAIYLNIDCVTALEARVYLQMDKYPEALAAANSLINNGKYALATSLDEFDDVWTYDRGKEVIFKFAASKTELPPAYGGSFFSEGYGGAGAADGVYYWSVDYIPTQDVVDMYDKDDYRGKSWIYMAKTSNDFNSQCWAGGDYLITPGFALISKFAGNPDLRTSNAWNFRNTWKVFRIAEMYLIAAEAAAQSGGDAATPLNALRTHRGLKALTSVTMADVKTERYKEMMLEGTRLTDLKRWGDGFKRGISQVGTFNKFNNLMGTVTPEKEDALAILAARTLDAKAGDFHFVWPIPYNEIYANQNLKGQQNPGWEK